MQRVTAGSGALDEIGDLSRGFSNVLQRLAPYTSYLENMASRQQFNLGTGVTPSVPVLGVLDLVVQMLDRLVTNAIDFAEPGTAITVNLSKARSQAELAVANQGPLLPREMEGRLFESIVSVRLRRGDSMPHLGLGLYIVRLIAEFHGGSAQTRNIDAPPAVAVSVTLPLP